MFERGFAEIDLSKRAPHLNLGDVGHVFRHRDLAVHLVAFDRQLLQQVGVPVRIDDLPMRIGSFGSLEVIGQSQDAVAVFGRVCDVTGVGFRALKRSALVTSWAKLLVAAMASAVKEARIVLYIMCWVVWFLFRRRIIRNCFHPIRRAMPESLQL